MEELFLEVYTANFIAEITRKRAGEKKIGDLISTLTTKENLEKSLIENGEPGLNADTSIEDVAKSLAGLAAGDGALAGKGYERLVTRWRRVASFEQAM